ncbi:hypothetical protein [Polyangium jinanense]|uniref:Uncharacterized protein n=1 Tax=Polyangium jinanense TaxID=2829994 RepID=A0A9X3XDR6_9BACT|nr:hypothetical protein [Polyangium jinanense]MDC3960013.1 hypothetical protein [Polyangium jinanense]MDC3986231.1 hypothetical protein [Polyangium jinanense]
MTSFQGLDDWFDYSTASWRAAGGHAPLDPRDIPRDPTSYNRETYRWLAARYRHIYLDFYEAIRADGTLIRQQPAHFARQWAAHYESITIWKQVCPLFVFGQALGGLDARHRDLARAYVLGYGIPVMAIDRMMDALPGTPSSKNTWLFVLASYALGLEQLRKVDAKASVESCFLRHTQEMYHFFWGEERERYRLPEAVSAATLNEYLEGHSRLLSSIFFAVTIEWAFVLAKGALPPEFAPALVALRKMRQLNDELVDADEDIRYGIVTFPYLHGLASPHGAVLAQNIISTWQLDRDEPGSPKMALLTAQRRAILQEAGSLEAAAQASMRFLRTVMQAVMSHFPAENAFDVTLLVNQRVSHLFRLLQHGWNEIPNVYQPEPFSEASEPAAPLRVPWK